MAKGKLWTPQELLILEECVKSSKTHTEGYKKASKKLGRSERACTQVFLKGNFCMRIYRRILAICKKHSE